MPPSWHASSKNTAICQTKPKSTCQESNWRRCRHVDDEAPACPSALDGDREQRALPWPDRLSRNAAASRLGTEVPMNQCLGGAATVRASPMVLTQSSRMSRDRDRPCRGGAADKLGAREGLTRARNTSECNATWMMCVSTQQRASPGGGDGRCDVPRHHVQD